MTSPAVLGVTSSNCLEAFVTTNELATKPDTISSPPIVAALPSSVIIELITVPAASNLVTVFAVPAEPPSTITLFSEAFAPAFQ